MLTSVKYIFQKCLSFIARGHSSYLNLEISCKGIKIKIGKQFYRCTLNFQIQACLFYILIDALYNLFLVRENENR